jgi:uncharacterized protein with PIN domain
MFVDASALVAILLEEKDLVTFAAALDGSDASWVTPFVVMETGFAVMRDKPPGLARSF